MTSGAGRTVAYTAFGMSAQVNAGQPSATTLSYDSEHARVQQVSPVGTTLYLADAGTGAMTERLTPAAGGSNRWTTYLMADGRMVAQRHTIGSSTSPVMTYFVADHLGSVIATIDDETTPVVTRQSYDPWGRMRNADGSADTTCALPAQLQSNANVTRGYTGQEQMPAICLDNYNARLYDPTLGRFLAADPSDGSGLNRYWYVADNPLSLNDPTGLCFLGCFWKGGLVREVAAIIAAVVLQQPQFLPAAFAAEGLTAAEAAFVSAGVAGGISGFIATGKLEGAGIGALEALSFAAFAPSFGARLSAVFGSATVGKFIANGLIGGLFSVGSKGGLASGFLAAGFGSLADNIDAGSFAANAFVHAAAGGVGAVLGGGKFVNGALTGAFGYAATSITSAIDVEDDNADGVSGPAKIINSLRPQLHVVDGMLTGTVTVACPPSADCDTILNEMRAFNHIYGSGKSRYGFAIDIEKFQGAGWQSHPDIVVSEVLTSTVDNGDMHVFCSSGCKMDIFNNFATTPAHEFGHYLGFGHSGLAFSVMGPALPQRLPYPTASEAREMIDAYKNK